MAGSPFNALVASRYADFTRRVLGEEIRFDSVAPELMPVIELGVVDRSEWLYPQGVRLWTTGPVQIAAAIGNFGKIEIPNTSDNLVIVVTVVRVLASVAAGTYEITMDGPAQGTPTHNFARDSRVPGLKVQSLNRIGNGAGGVGGNILDEITVPIAQDGVFSGGPWVITPGHNLQLWDLTTNQLLRGLFDGYEYNSLPQELAP